nr:immunoglobulin heavy chain junction region [Macaca mulatta]
CARYQVEFLDYLNEAFDLW